MHSTYFKRVTALTCTKFWINNVTREEARWALAAGAVGCTQNPSYAWKMLTHPTEKEHAYALLDEALRESNDDNEVECILQHKLVKGISDEFLPLWHSSAGEHGYVTIQGDPIHEEDAQVIIEEGRKNRSINPNVMIKIPATKAGLQAMQVLIAEDTPINATEVMGLRQALDACQMYRKTTEATGKKPKIFYSLITGIYDEYLQRYVKQENIDISPDILHTAGMIIAKKTYAVTKALYPEVGFVGGGVRRTHHFTEMIGGDVCITMNWTGQAEELLKLDQPVVPRLFNPVPELYLDTLLSKVPEFRRAYFESGLTVEEYEHFGPVAYFRNMFVMAWKNALEAIAKRRTELRA
jgi:transaldolase